MPSFSPPGSPAPDFRSDPSGGVLSGSARIIVLVSVSVVLIGGGLLIAGTLLGLGRGDPVQLAVRPADRELLVTAADLLPYAPDLLVRNDAESITRLRARDRRHALRYEYRHPQPPPKLSVVCEVIVEPSEERARAAFGALDAAMMRSLEELGADVRFAPKPTVWNRDSTFGQLTEHDEPVGFLLVGRLDNRLYALRVHGLAIDPDRALEELAIPWRSAMAGYDP